MGRPGIFWSVKKGEVATVVVCISERNYQYRLEIHKKNVGLVSFIVFVFTPNPREMIRFDGGYFSNGLVQPPTSITQN